MQNLANFTSSGKLGEMLAKSRHINQLNAQLKTQLPADLSALELCYYDDDSATLITNNQALAFRAQQQKSTLIKILKQINDLGSISSIQIKVDIEG